MLKTTSPKHSSREVYFFSLANLQNYFCTISNLVQVDLIISYHHLTSRIKMTLNFASLAFFLLSNTLCASLSRDVGAL